MITRQPAEEKRFTVAWPMPREAPVSSIVRRAPAGFEARDMEDRDMGRFRVAVRIGRSGAAAATAPFAKSTPG